MKRLIVETGTKVYPILIAADVLKHAQYFQEFVEGKKVVILTNKTVGSLYGNLLRETLKNAGAVVLSLIEIGDGEKYKNSQTLSFVYEQLFQARADRKTVLFALGGGVVGDIGGFASATYMRGIPYIQVPTTLLAQIDSSIGGKTGINHAAGKNMVGSFKHPLAVFSDIGVLSTLPKRELSAGIAEAIKSALIADALFFSWLESNVKSIFSLSNTHLSELIYRTCQIKKNIVEKDEFEETGLRGLLNFGHNVGHAVESMSNYESFLHGEAVAIGMCAESYFSNKLASLDQTSIVRIEKLIESFNLPQKMPDWTIDGYMSLLLMDKKNIDGKLCFTLLDSIGKADLKYIEQKDIRALLLAYLGH